VTPQGLQTAFRALDIDVAKAMSVFGRAERTIYYWLDPSRDGPPDHIALAVSEMLAGTLEQNKVKAFIKECRSRRDGDRYERG
jgi:hypothetical protein